MAQIVLEPRGRAHRIKTLRGTIAVRVVDRRPLLLTSRVLASKGRKFQLGERTLEITESRCREDGLFCVAVGVHPCPGERQVSWPGQVRVEDANGNQCKARSWGTREASGVHEIFQTFVESRDESRGPPARLIIENWYTLNHEIPFEFKDVPLP